MGLLLKLDYGKWDCWCKGSVHFQGRPMGKTTSIKGLPDFGSRAPFVAGLSRNCDLRSRWPPSRACWASPRVPCLWAQLWGGVCARPGGLLSVSLSTASACSLQRVGSWFLSVGRIHLSLGEGKGQPVRVS